MASICATAAAATGQQVTKKTVVIIRQLTIQQRASLRGGPFVVLART